MIEVKDSNKTIWFSRQEDADNYNDYLKNGLKIIRKDGRTYYYNNGDRLINVSIQGETKQKYILHYRNGRTAASEKLQKKHIQAIAN